MQGKMIEKAKELLQNGTVNRVLGWKTGEFDYDITPAVFNTAEELERDFVYNTLAAANLSKYLVKESKKTARCLYSLSLVILTAFSSSLRNTESSVKMYILLV